MLNTLRTIVNNDEQWRGMLRALGEKFYHQTVTSEALENYMAEFLGLELNAFFDQYLRDRRLATLEYYFKDGKLYHRWINAIPSFDMPVDVEVNGKSMRIEPRSQWNSIPVDGTTLTVEPNYYIAVLKSR